MQTPPDHRRRRRQASRRRFLRATGGAVAAGLAWPALSWGATASPGAVTDLSALRRQLGGVAVGRQDPDYEAWRQSMIWQYRKFARHPDVIVQAESTDDVVSAIAFAREHGLRITSRGGGHSWSGCFLRDGGVLLDLSRLQRIEIDPATRIARVQAGVIGRRLSAALAHHGLAFPTAHCGMVPLSGFLLGGGLGWNSTAWGGMSVFNIVALDIVTAEGEHLHVSADRHADYFWAARGGGPGLFFTVTDFYLQCHPLPRAITTDYYFFRHADLGAVVAMMDEVGPQLDPNLEALTVVIPTPPDLAGQCSGDDCGRIVVLSAVAFADTTHGARRMLAPFARHAVMRDAIRKIPGRPTPMEVLYQDNEGPFPQRRARADNIYTDRIVDAARVLGRHMPSAPSPGNTPVILWRGDLAFPDAACSTSGRFYLAGYAQWDDAATDIANQDWLRALYDEMQPLATGHYINEFDRETRAAQTPACFAPANWQRLRELRGRYDPDGVFHDFLGL